MVIQTLSGCYRGEFPHVPVSGASGTTSRVVRKDLGDLISLKELRRSSLPEILSLLPTSESPSPEFESPVDISHTSCHQTSSDTTALLPHPQTIITEDSVYAKHSSCESAVLSSDSANFSLEGVVSTDTSGKGDIQTHSQDAVECSQSKSDRVLTDVSTVVEEANIDLSSEDEKEEEEEIQVDDKDYEGDREEEAEDKEEKTRGGQGEDRCGCRAYGDGLAWGTILDTNSFIIDTVAADQGEVRVSVEGTSEGLVSGTEVYPVEDSPGVYQVLYRVTTPGHYQVVITWDGQHIPGSPFTCVVG
ncbi:hypothetical protein OTU49_010295 [Cherax quadricarinatus]|uniref:Uncharacterized protein n=1 Tax=Cherax quadricarinatus TaxID=27406 RepID=A0AAW0WGZ2_CHEQU